MYLACGAGIITTAQALQRLSFEFALRTGALCPDLTYQDGCKLNATAMRGNMCATCHHLQRVASFLGCSRVQV